MIIIEDLLEKKYPKWKETNGKEFLDDLTSLINDGTLEYVGQGTFKKGTDLANIYRGKGLTLGVKAGNNEFITLLEQGKGMDLGIMFK